MIGLASALPTVTVCRYHGNVVCSAEKPDSFKECTVEQRNVALGFRRTSFNRQYSKRIGDSREIDIHRASSLFYISLFAFYSFQLSIFLILISIKIII